MDFLGCAISRKPTGEYVLSQAKYAQNIIDEFGRDVEPQLAPLPATDNSIVDTSEVKSYRYREILGKLGYLLLSRLDMLHALHAVAKVKQFPRETQIAQLEHLLGYLKHTVQQQSTFYTSTNNNTNILAGISDAEWAGNSESRRSVGGNFIFFNSSCVCGMSKTQNIVTTSAANAELVELSRATKQLIYLKGQLEELSVEQIHTVLLSDSQSSVDAVHRSVTEKSKHMAIYLHFIKQELSSSFAVRHIKREQNFADLLTKQSRTEEFRRLWQAASSPFLWIHKLL